MRRGSLTVRLVKCSRPGCPCKDRPEARHGPYDSLTRSIDGHTQSRLVPEVHGQLVRRQIEDGRAFRDAFERHDEGEVELVHPRAAGHFGTEMVRTLNGLVSVVVVLEAFDAKRVKGTARGGEGGTIATPASRVRAPVGPTHADTYSLTRPSRA